MSEVFEARIFNTAKLISFHIFTYLPATAIG